MENEIEAKNVDEQVTSSHREQRPVLLSSEESQRAIKWARDHAEELEKFHRRECEYYAELPRSAADHANAKLYARLKRAMAALLEPQRRCGRNRRRKN
jgi:hypothetical protein